MKVILLQDVAKIGRRHEVASVPDGYALNKLIPQRLAKPATPENMKSIEAMAGKTQADREKSDAAFSEALATLKDASVSVEVEANEEGRMFQALKVEAVAEAIQASGANVPVASIHIATPIKQVGTHTVALVSGNTQESLTINVVAK